MKAYIKKFLPVILAVSILLGSMALCISLVDFNSALTPVASAAEAGDLVVSDFGDGTCWINCFNKLKEVDDVGELIIPETIDGLTVTGIRKNAFDGCTELTRIVLPDTVTVIEQCAFRGCTNLEEFVMSDNITSIGWSAFANCEKLSDITIPEKVTLIGNGAFYNTAYYNDESNWEDGLLYVDNCLIGAKSDISGEVTIKDGTRIMIGSAFYGRENITKVTVPGSISVVSKNAFYDCVNLEELVLLEGVKKIEDGAFEFCSKLYKITIPASFEEFSRGALGHARITEPYYNGTVDQWASISFGSRSSNPIYTAKALYINGEKLTEAVISSPVVNDYAFYCCESLEKVTFTDSVEEIGREAFGYNYYIKEISFGKNLKSVDRDAFTYCSRVEKVNTTMTLNQWSQIDFTTWNSNPVSYSKCLYINGELLENAGFSDITEIKPLTFFGCASIKSITIPETVETIGEGAFSGTSIEELVLPEGVTLIERSAFGNNKALKSVTFPSTLKGVDYYAFEFSDNINYVNFTGTVNQWVRIGFASDTSNPVFHAKNLHINGELLEDAVIENVERIGSYAFINCEALKNVYIGDGVKAIGGQSFMNCLNLETVDLPASLQNSYHKSFWGCTGLKRVNYRGTVDEWVMIDFSEETSNPVRNSHNLYLNDVLLENAEIKEANRIEEYVFINCDTLKTVVIGGNVGRIYSDSFESCTGLVSVDIEGSTISGSAFLYCSSLVEVNISEEGKSFDLSSYAFYECTSLEEIVLPKRVTGIGNATFSKCTSLKVVYLSEDIGSIGYDAFYHCPSLEIVYYESTETDYEEIDVHQLGNEALLTAETHYNVHDVESHYTIVTVEATCTEDGSISKSCPCGYSSFTIIQAANHKPVIANQKDATCTTDGYTGDTICEACQEVFEHGHIIVAFGHLGGTATCNKQALCERCNEYYGELLPHSFSNTFDKTCNECGYDRELNIPQKPVENTTQGNIPNNIQNNTQDNVQNTVQDNTQYNPQATEQSTLPDSVQSTEQNTLPNNEQKDNQNPVQNGAKITGKTYWVIGGLSVLLLCGCVITKKRKLIK